MAAIGPANEVIEGYLSAQQPAIELGAGAAIPVRIASLGLTGGSQTHIEAGTTVQLAVGLVASEAIEHCA